MRLSECKTTRDQIILAEASSPIAGFGPVALRVLDGKLHVDLAEDIAGIDMARGAAANLCHRSRGEDMQRAELAKKLLGLKPPAHLRQAIRLRNVAELRSYAGGKDLKPPKVHLALGRRSHKEVSSQWGVFKGTLCVLITPDKAIELKNALFAL